MTHRHQRGWLKKEKRSQGETWVLFFRTVRTSDGRRVENKIPIGLVRDFPDKSCAWTEVERQHLHINQVNSRRSVIFADLAQHYAENELGEYTESIHPKAHTTIRAYERVLRNRLLPRWGNRIALGIEPLVGGAMAEGSQTRKGSSKSNARQDSPCYVPGVQAWPTIRPDSSKSGVKPNAFRPLQDHQWVRSNDSHS